MLCPSTPAAPLFARTLVQASASVLGANTLSIRLNHLPPLTPLASADSMRSVHTPASADVMLRVRASASAPCLAFPALPALSCLGLSVTHPPPCPAFPRTGLCCPVLSRFPPLAAFASVLCGL